MEFAFPESQQPQIAVQQISIDYVDNLLPPDEKHLPTPKDWADPRFCQLDHGFSPTNQELADNNPIMILDISTYGRFCLEQGVARNLPKTDLTFQTSGVSVGGPNPHRLTITPHFAVNKELFFVLIAFGAALASLVTNVLATFIYAFMAEDPTTKLTHIATQFETSVTNMNAELLRLENLRDAPKQTAVNRTELDPQRALRTIREFLGRLGVR